MSFLGAFITASQIRPFRALDTIFRRKKDRSGVSSVQGMRKMQARMSETFQLQNWAVKRPRQLWATNNAKNKSEGLWPDGVFSHKKKMTRVCVFCIHDELFISAQLCCLFLQTCCTCNHVFVERMCFWLDTLGWMETYCPVNPHILESALLSAWTGWIGFRWWLRDRRKNCEPWTGPFARMACYSWNLTFWLCLFCGWVFSRWFSKNFSCLTATGAGVVGQFFKLFGKKNISGKTKMCETDPAHSIPQICRVRTRRICTWCDF